MLYVNAPSEITLGQVCPFVYTYFFESTSFYLLAMKRSDGFREKQWLMIQKANLKVSSLNLQFMDASTFVEERFFAEGYLKFNGANGTYIEKYNSAQYGLVQIHSLAIPNSIQQAVIDFMGT